MLQGDVEKVPDPKGDRVKITFNGKVSLASAPPVVRMRLTVIFSCSLQFLPYKRW